MKEAITTNSSSDPVSDLTGIPYIGLARRNMLASKGITTREHLAQVTTEELMSLVRTSRAQAEAILAVVRDTLKDNDSAKAVVEPNNDAALADSPRTRPTRQPRLRAATDAQISRLRDALAGAAGQDNSKLEKVLIRLSTLADGASAQTGLLKPRSLKKLARRMERVADRLERYVARPSAKSKLVKRLRDSLNKERRAAQQLLPVKRKTLLIVR